MNGLKLESSDGILGLVEYLLILSLKVLAFLIYLLLIFNLVWLGNLWGSLPVKISPCFLLGKEVEWLWSVWCVCVFCVCMCGCVWCVGGEKVCVTARLSSRFACGNVVDWERVVILLGLRG